MRQGPTPRRSRGRNNNRKQSVPLKMQTFDSNGPDVRIRGNAYQVFEKYLQLARDANASGDRIKAENHYQHAEHYFRLINAEGNNNGRQQNNRQHHHNNGQHQGSTQNLSNADVSSEEEVSQADAAPASNPVVDLSTQKTEASSRRSKKEHSSDTLETEGAVPSDSSDNSDTGSVTSSSETQSSEAQPSEAQPSEAWASDTSEEEPRPRRRRSPTGRLGGRGRSTGTRTTRSPTGRTRRTSKSMNMDENGSEASAAPAPAPAKE